jgi:dTDP-glucose pyrophosphorylase/CBS domain-containing protein
MHIDVKDMCVSLENTIHEAIALMEVNRNGIVLALDSERRLLGTITDGDVRRAILANVDMDQLVESLLVTREATPFATPIAAPSDSERDDLLAILQRHKIQHLPLVDEDGRVVDLVTLDEFLPQRETPEQAVIMAGGQGIRLRPLTNDMPKPMLPVGGRPLMEITLERLRDVGIQQVHITLHHKPEKVTDYFGDGQKFGVDINYVNEEEPLGTAGALGLMEPPRKTILVINGDVLTNLDFRSLMAYHRDNQAQLTMVVQQYNIHLPYGVVECEDTLVSNLEEKPTKNFLVNAGIYLLEPMVYDYIPSGQRLDMTELIQRLLDESLTVAAFPLREYWVDIGKLSDYEQAQKDIQSGAGRT